MRRLLLSSKILSRVALMTSRLWQKGTFSLGILPFGYPLDHNISNSFQECSKYMSPNQISNFLDGAIRNRISVRLIAEQHIALSRALKTTLERNSVTHNGIVNMKCSPSDMIRMCGSFVSELCDATLGISPPLRIDGHKDATFSCVPALDSSRHWTD
jgi:hypothetical protein